MSGSLTVTPSSHAAPQVASGRLSIYMELGKARLSALVVLTTAVGFVLASPGGIDWLQLFCTTLGTAMCAWSANAFNQCVEWTRDARMHRTQGRPLPTARIGLAHARVAAAIVAAAGALLLWVMVNPLASTLAVATIALYVLAYTPLKVRSTFNTLVGAVVGAIPPMIGWAGGAGHLTAGAWSLAAVMLVWQVPHFLSLAWMYREDYVRGGFRMLPSVDPDGRITGRVILIWSVALVPVAMALSLTGATGLWYAAGAMVLGGWLVVRSIKLHRSLTPASARAVFIASIIYLPLLLCLMMLDRPRLHVPATAGPVPARSDRDAPEVSHGRNDREDRRDGEVLSATGPVFAAKLGG